MNSKPTPQADSLLGLHLFTDTLVQLAPHLWRGEATRAVKHPGKGDRHLVIIGPGRPYEKAHIHGMKTPEWTVRGTMWQDSGHVMRWKVRIDSPTKTEAWQSYHHAVVFAPDYATGQSILDMLALNLVVTDFTP